MINDRQEGVRDAEEVIDDNIETGILVPDNRRGRIFIQEKRRPVVAQLEATITTDDLKIRLQLIDRVGQRRQYFGFND